jgi:hypothetical protein
MILSRSEEPIKVRVTHPYDTAAFDNPDGEGFLPVRWLMLDRKVYAPIDVIANFRSLTLDVIVENLWGFDERLNERWKML